MGYYQDMSNLLNKKDFEGLKSCSDKVLADLFMRKPRYGDDDETLNQKTFEIAMCWADDEFLKKLVRSLSVYKKDEMVFRTNERTTFMNKTGVDFFFDEDFTSNGAENFLWLTGITKYFNARILFWAGTRRYIDIAIEKGVQITLPKGGKDALDKVIDDIKADKRSDEKEKQLIIRYAKKLFKYCKYGSDRVSSVTSKRSEFYDIELDV